MLFQNSIYVGHLQFIEQEKSNNCESYVYSKIRVLHNWAVIHVFYVSLKLPLGINQEPHV